MDRTQLKTLAAEIRTAPYRALLAAWDYAGIAAKLNERKALANPVERANKPVPITWDAFLGALEAGDVLKLYGYGDLARDLRAALERNDRTEAAALYRGLAPALTAASRTAVQAALNQTQPDPAWTATVLAPSRATELGLPAVAEADVQRAAAQ